MDIKPENVIIDDDFIIRLIDYGYAVKIGEIHRGGTAEYSPFE